MTEDSAKPSRPQLNSSNVAIALKHPSLLLAMARGADRQELQRILMKKTVFKEMSSLLETTRRNARDIPPLAGSPGEKLAKLQELCSALARSDRGRRGDSYYAALYLIIRDFRPEIVVETGVWWGTSSLFMLQAMEDFRSGSLYSVDLPNASYALSASDSHADIIPSETDTGSMVPSDLRRRWQLTLGKSQEKLPSLLDGLGTIDVFVHDSEHVAETMLFEYEEAWKHLRPGGLLLSDDTDWNDAFSRFAKSKSAGFREFEKYGQNRFGVAVR
jgi:predicted O-methyltransferase YrrM